MLPIHAGHELKTAVFMAPDVLFSGKRLSVSKP
jgi:hypothetical protein